MSFLRYFLHSSRSSLLVLTVGFATGFLLHPPSSSSSTFVFARSPDTPAYLIPYYLRTTHARFNHYASLRHGDSSRSMSLSDFVRALMAEAPETQLSDVSTRAIVEELAPIFTAMDTDGDGTLSFTEFATAILLLQIPLETFQQLFTVLSERGDLTLSRTEFGQMLRATAATPEEQRELSRDFVSRKGFAQSLLFKSSENCSFDSFSEFVSDLRRTVERAAFRVYDPECHNVLSPSDFASLLFTQSIVGRHVPFFLVENARRLQRSGNSSISLETWHSFNTVCRLAEGIAESLYLFTSATTDTGNGGRDNGPTIAPEDLARAIQAASFGSVSLSEKDRDILFGLFDRQQRGSLDLDEFIAVMKAKAEFQAMNNRRQQGEHLRLWTRLQYCLIG